MVDECDGAAEWLSVAPAEALAPLQGVHPGVDEWLDIAGQERRVGVIPEVPVLVGVQSDGAAIGVAGLLDVRMIDFMNHPEGAAVSSPLTAQVFAIPVAGVLPLVSGSGQSMGFGVFPGFCGV